MYRSYCFEYSIVWSSFEQGKKSQHFLLDRVAKLSSLCLEEGQGQIMGKVSLKLKMNNGN